MNKEVVVAIYGIFQIYLKEKDMLDKTGAPKKRKKQGQDIIDIFSIYDFLSNILVNVSVSDINNLSESFNKHAKQLHDEYQVNMLLLGIFLFESYIEEQPRHHQLIYIPKIVRLSKYAQEHISKEVIRDSKIAADNIYRKYIGKAEVTKEIRELNEKEWRKRCKYSDMRL